ncbi:MAG: hypothetical protein WAU75_24235 [Solirubrobacteraceae bacterium]
MTDYITDLRDALHDAAAREYSAARAPRPSRARTGGRRRVLTRSRPTALAGISLLAAVAAATVVLVLGATTTTPPAYALVQHPDGSVTVTVHNLHTALRPLNARLAALGINERMIPISDTCPRSNLAFVYPVKRSQFPQLRWTFTPRESRRHLATGDWGYIGIGRSDSGELLLAQGAMKPPLPSCFNSALGQFTTTPTP